MAPGGDWRVSETGTTPQRAQCETCGETDAQFTISIDRRAWPVYGKDGYLFKPAPYAYCSQVCALAFFESFPKLAMEYITVRQLE